MNRIHSEHQLVLLVLGLYKPVRLVQEAGEHAAQEVLNVGVIDEVLRCPILGQSDGRSHRRNSRAR